MRLNTIATLGASAVFGIAAIFLAQGWVDDAVNDGRKSNAPIAESAAPQIETAPILIADVDLAFGDHIAPQSLRIAHMPVELLPAGHFGAFEDLFINTDIPTVALTNIAANETILPHKISGPAGRASLSAMIGDGMRAFTISVNQVSGVAGFVQPHDSVDILLTTEIAGAGIVGKTRGDSGASEFKSSVLAQNVKVLGTGQKTEIANGEPQIVKTITLEVEHRQTQQLALASAMGQLSLSLRQFGDHDRAASVAMTSRNLGNSRTAASRRPKRRRSAAAAAPQPQQQNSGTALVTVIRGKTKDEVSVFTAAPKSAQPAENASPQLAGG